jgi:hypothetical protein
MILSIATRAQSDPNESHCWPDPIKTISDVETAPTDLWILQYREKLPVFLDTGIIATHTPTQTSSLFPTCLAQQWKWVQYVQDKRIP